MRGSAAAWTRWDVAGIGLWAALGLASLLTVAQGADGYAILVGLSGIPALALAVASVVAWRRGDPPPLPGRSTTTQNEIAFAFVLAWLLVGAAIGILSEPRWPIAVLFNANGFLIGMLIATRVHAP